jgi:hypothetical protein
MSAMLRFRLASSTKIKYHVIECYLPNSGLVEQNGSELDTHPIRETDVCGIQKRLKAA